MGAIEVAQPPAGDWVGGISFEHLLESEPGVIDASDRLISSSEAVQRDGVVADPLEDRRVDRDGVLSTFDVLVRDRIHERFAYRFVAAGTYAEATAVENAIKLGALGQPRGSTQPAPADSSVLA